VCKLRLPCSSAGATGEEIIGSADAWAGRRAWITARLQEHFSLALKQAELTPRQVADILNGGRESTHWGTQIDTAFKRLVETDPLLSGEVAVSPRRLPSGSGAPDVIDLRTKSWWDATTTWDQFLLKGPKYNTQYGRQSTALLYGEP